MTSEPEQGTLPHLVAARVPEAPSSKASLAAELLLNSGKGREHWVSAASTEPLWALTLNTQPTWHRRSHSDKAAPAKPLHRGAVPHNSTPAFEMLAKGTASCTEDKVSCPASQDASCDLFWTSPTQLILSLQPPAPTSTSARVRACPAAAGCL